MYQVTSATCCKDHIPRWKDKSSYWRKLIWSIRKRYATMKNHVSFHTSHVLYRPYQTKKKRNEKGKKEIHYQKGGTPLHDFWESHYAHMVLTVMRQVQGPFDWNFICSKTAGICGINLRSTTVVCWQVHSPMGDPSSRVENKKRKRKKVLELNYLNQKFGTAFLQFRFWSGKNHLDGAGWFFVSDG